jgi:hypothetical protein
MASLPFMQNDTESVIAVRRPVPRHQLVRKTVSTAGVDLDDLYTFMAPEQIEHLRQALAHEAQLRRDAVAESYQHRIT